MRNILIMILLISGCTSFIYKEPTQGSRAQVRFVTTSAMYTTFRVYKDSNCSGNEEEWMSLKNGFSPENTPKISNVPLSSHDKNAAKEVYVAANKNINAIFFGGRVISTTSYVLCGVPFDYRFLENKVYEVRFDTDSTQCLVTVSELSQIDGKLETTILKNFNTRETQTSSGCAKKLNHRVYSVNQGRRGLNLTTYK